MELGSFYSIIFFGVQKDSIIFYDKKQGLVLYALLKTKPKNVTYLVDRYSLGGGVNRRLVFWFGFLFGLSITLQALFSLGSSFVCCTKC